MFRNTPVKMTTARLINGTLRKTFGVELKRVPSLSKRTQAHAHRVITTNTSLLQACLPHKEIITILHEVDKMLCDAHIVIGNESSVELSHHFGLEQFREYGAVIIDCINRQYCKKLLVQLPGQRHPYHFHKRKEETFQLLAGDLDIKKDGLWTHLLPGETMLVKRRERHKFRTEEGAIIEEISTTHYKNDSFYTNPQIARLARNNRKTQIWDWQKSLVLSQGDRNRESTW